MSRDICNSKCWKEEETFIWFLCTFLFYFVCKIRTIGFVMCLFTILDKIVLKHSKKKNNKKSFERNTLDIFSIKAPVVGELEKIK